MHLSRTFASAVKDSFMGMYKQVQPGDAVHFPQRAQHACLSTHAVEICSLCLAG